MKISIFLSIICLFRTATCYKVLMIFSCPAPSHYILGSAIAKGLLKSGFHVTMISGYGEKTAHENYTDILLEEIGETHKGIQQNQLFQNNLLTPIDQLSILRKLGITYTEAVLSHPKVKNLLNSNATFDAVITEQFFNDGLKYFAHHYNVPLIVLSTVGANRWVNIYTGNPAPPSYVPEIRLGYTTSMTFRERTYNFLYGILHNLHLYYSIFKSQESVLKKYIPNSSNLEDIIYNASLVLLNSHESISPAVPLVPNMVNIGGFHVTPPKELPTDLKVSIDNAKEGVIYFSMGSNLLPSTMPKDKKEAIFNVLGTRKEMVLWKWDQESMPGQPKNVITSKWFPQQSILAHKNVKLFITHCGFLSIIEATYYGVPVLCLPAFGDQMMNGNRIIQLGMGKSIDFISVNQENFGQAVNEILDNPEYKANAAYKSKLFHDRPMHPLDLAIYWIKYVIEHKGAPHLRVAGATMPWYQYIMLDVVLTLVLLVLVVVFVIFRLVKCVFRKEKSKLKNN